MKSSLCYNLSFLIGCLATADISELADITKHLSNGWNKKAALRPVCQIHLEGGIEDEWEQCNLNCPV